MGGRNWCDKMRDGYRQSTDGAPDPAAVQLARCDQGQHEETAVPRYYTAYVAGKRVPEGTVYCRRCSAILRLPEGY